MKTLLLRSLFGLALLGPVLMTGSDLAFAGNCLNAAAARLAVNSGKAAPLSHIIKRVRGRGDIVGANLCNRGGTLVYVITILRTNGVTKRLVVDARTGR